MVSEHSPEELPETLQEPMNHDEAVGGGRSRRGGRKSRRGGKKSRKGGRKSRRGGKAHMSHKHKGGRKSRRGGLSHKKLHKKKSHKKSVGGKRKSCPKYCRRKTVRCKSYKKVGKMHKKHRK